MEDPRISRMYLAMVQRGLERVLGGFRAGAWLRSTVTWFVLLIVALMAAGVAIHEKGRGDLTKIKKELGSAPPPQEAAAPQPGGQDPVVLSRAQRMGGVAPEFLSATLLPGRGMNVLQITAFIPGRGEVALLQAPSLAVAAQQMSGANDDQNGEQSLTMGGAIELPWAGRIPGAALPGGSSVMAYWGGRGLTLPLTSSGAGHGSSSTGGLLLKRAADSSKSSVMPDGGIAQATDTVGSFDGHWPSTSEVKTSVLLSGKSVDLTITVQNTGTNPEPMGIGWAPRFAVAPTERAQMRIRLSAAARLEAVDRHDFLPSGKLLPVAGTDFDYSAPSGVALGTRVLNETFAHLKSGTLSSGPEVDLRNPAGGYGIRLTALTTTVRAIHIDAPADGGIIVLRPQTHYDDPLGREWQQAEDTGLTTLQPGESLQYKVRLELFALTGPL